MKLCCPGQWIQCVPETTRQAVFLKQGWVLFLSFLFLFIPVSPQHNVGTHKYLDVNIL